MPPRPPDCPHDGVHDRHADHNREAEQKHPPAAGTRLVADVAVVSGEPDSAGCQRGEDPAREHEEEDGDGALAKGCSMRC